MPGSSGASAAHRILLVLGMLLAASPALGAKRPQRIVSLNMCADQYLLALADRRQIAALTTLSRDPVMSAAAEQAMSMPVSKGSVEEVVTLRPDLIVASPGQRLGPRAALAKFDVPALELPFAESYADIRDQIRKVALAVGHADRGEALIRRMDAGLASLPRPRGGGVAAYYQRRGYLTGTGTLIDELVTRAGLTNLATQLGKPALSRLSIEELIVARPDYLIVEEASGQVIDQGTEMLNHPALRHIPRLTLPQAWTVCGGPAYVKAARSLAGQLAAARRTGPARH